jgi:ubiquinone/menaquinone biosynthesis C-methylase UbiE
VGCGEGRFARELTALGYRATATDAVAEMVAAAREAGSAAAYAVAPAENLPFADAAFDLVVAYNVLMDVDDLAGALAEARRVVRPGGRLMVSIVHPLVDRGRFADAALDAPFVLDTGWFETLRFEGR